MNLDIKTTVLVLAGPTASGKTALAVELAKHYNGEIVSADSMQIYRHMNIGTAKPSVTEMDGVPHHLIDCIEPTEEFSLADYLRMAHNIIADINKRGKLPIITGGTGLYISSLINDVKLDETKPSQEVRNELIAYAHEYGNEKLYEMLIEIDPIAAQKIHPNNIIRVVRAIEAFKQTGIQISKLQENSRISPSRYNALKLGISYKDRSLLYDRINKRVDNMVDNGLIEEATAVFGSPYLKTALQAIGYKELFPFFKNEINLMQAIDNLKQSSRRYAKRQLTWFRRDNEINWFYPDEYQNIQIMQKNIYNLVDKFLKMCYDDSNSN